MEKKKDKHSTPLVIGGIVVVLLLIVFLVDLLTDCIRPAKVTASEFDRIHAGMSYEEVCAVVGDNAHKAYRMTTAEPQAPKQEYYTYDGVGMNSEVVICFEEGKVAWKKHKNLLGELLSADTELR